MKLKMMMLELLLLLALLDSALPAYVRSTPRRRDAVVNLHIVKRPLLPFNITLLQSQESYYTNGINIDDVIEESVTSFLQEEFEEAYHSFYAMEMGNLPSTAELEWPHIRINVSFAGNFIFVLSGVPEDSEIHCRQRRLLIETYLPEFDYLVDFNETAGGLELDYIQFDNNIFCPPIDHNDDDDHTFDGDKDDDDDEGNIATVAESSKSESNEEKIITRKDFLLSWEFMCVVLATVVLPTLVCMSCVCRKTRKIRKIRGST